MLIGDEMKCFKRSTLAKHCGQKRNKRRASRLSVRLLITLILLAAGCSGKKDQKTMIDALNKSMNRDRIMLALPLGRVGKACADSNIESKPVPEQAIYADTQKAGLITIAPDGSDFWKVELVNPSPQIAEALKKAAHKTKDGCDSMAFSFSVAYKAVSEVRNVRKVDDGQSEVEFTWKWTLATLGTKFVSSLSSQELAELNDHLENPVLDQHRDPSFNIADMAQTGAPQSMKVVLRKSGDDWVADLSPDGRVAEAKRKYEALQDQLAKLENSMPKPGEWVRAESTDKMDGSQSVQFKSFSENKVQLAEQEERLLLAVGCDKYVDLFIEPGPVTSPNIRYKFDNATTGQDRWSESDNRYLMKALVEKDFLKRMVGAKNLKIEFTPLGKEPQIASFDMGNFKELIQNEKGCNFMKKAWALNF
jgi:hypothetical protein